MCHGGTVVFALLSGYRSAEFAVIFGIMAAGILVSVTAYAVLGICAHGQMEATSSVDPFALVFSLLPMLSMFNDTIRSFAKIFHSDQMMTYRKK